MTGWCYLVNDLIVLILPSTFTSRLWRSINTNSKEIINTWIFFGSAKGETKFTKLLRNLISVHFSLSAVKSQSWCLDKSTQIGAQASKFRANLEILSHNVSWSQPKFSLSSWPTQGSDVPNSGSDEWTGGSDWSTGGSVDQTGPLRAQLVA